MAFIVKAKCINNHIHYLESQSANVVIITREMAALKLRRENTVSSICQFSKYTAGKFYSQQTNSSPLCHNSGP